MAEDPSPPSSLSIRTDQNDFDSFLKVEDMNDKLLIDLMMKTDTNVDGSGESKLFFSNEFQIYTRALLIFMF